MARISLSIDQRRDARDAIASGRQHHPRATPPHAPTLTRGDSFACMEREIKQYDYTCVPPTRVPALDHTRPADLTTTLYAVTDSGQLLCFQKENGPPCPSRAAQ